MVANLGDPGAVLAVDETGFLKKGRMSAGVARQYTGTAGRVENCQVGVFLAYCAPDGARALIDRELYIPRKWAEDRDRCAAAGIGAEVAFATKPKLAEAMIGRAVRAGVPFKWAAGDEAYGGNPGLREWLEAEEIPYVLAIACNAMISTKAGAKRADELAGLVPAGAWQRLSCADGSKGPRLYDWALVATDSDDHWLLARRSLQPGEKGDLELAFYRCYSPRPVTLAELAAVAGARWGVEDCFAEAKNEAGLDHYQVRRYRAWYRHITLAMLTRSSPSPRTPPAPPRHRRNRRDLPLPAETLTARPLKRGPDRCGQLFAPPRTYSPPAFITDETGRDLIPLTAAETRRLFNLHTRAARPAAFHEQWSGWRRRRQAAARKSHYARRIRDHEALL